MTFNIQHELAPIYISELIKPYIPNADQGLQQIPNSNVKEIEPSNTRHLLCGMIDLEIYDYHSLTKNVPFQTGI